MQKLPIEYSEQDENLRLFTECGAVVIQARDFALHCGAVLVQEAQLLKTVLLVRQWIFKEESLCVNTTSNAPINVMPHYPRYGLRWGKVGICTPENYNSPSTGEVLAIQTPTYPDKSPSSETRDKWG